MGLSGRPKAAVVVFYGSNCDIEAGQALRLAGFDVTFLSSGDALPGDLDMCFIPGGFSYGDYLRCGAISASLPIMNGVRNFANAGGCVLGVCNGFQILLESGLLPGALLPNESGKFVCRVTTLRCGNAPSPFTLGFGDGEEVSMQSAHACGRYYADLETMSEIENGNMVAFRYNENINGSSMDIAGLFGGECRNILGIMPHPERGSISADGLRVVKNVYQSVQKRRGINV